MPRRHFRQKERHHPGVGFGQEEGIERAIMRADGGEGERGFPHHLRPHFGTDPGRAPTVAGIAQTAKPAFVLEHQADGASRLRLAADFLGDPAGEFFFQASGAWISERGWRGAIFRQPWRASIRYTVDLGTGCPTACS